MTSTNMLSLAFTNCYDECRVALYKVKHPISLDTKTI
jgi:hypothetical protein